MDNFRALLPLFPIPVLLLLFAAALCFVLFEQDGNGIKSVFTSITYQVCIILAACINACM